MAITQNADGTFSVSADPIVAPTQTGTSIAQTSPYFNAAVLGGTVEAPLLQDQQNTSPSSNPFEQQTTSTQQSDLVPQPQSSVPSKIGRGVV